MNAAADAPVVFVVEDDDHIAQLLNFMLVREGYRVQLARDGREARSFIQTQSPPRIALFDVMLLSADFPEGFRAALKLRGIDAGESRQPFSAEQHLKMETISRQLACLLAEEGFADEPVGGCPVGSSDLDPEQVGRIVQGVLAELRERGLA